MKFIQSTGARNHFSLSYEQWQNGLAESAINLIMRLARTVMAVSGGALGSGGGSGSRQPSQVKTHTMLHTSSGSGVPFILAYMMVNWKMFQVHASALSDAEHGFTSMRKGGRRVSTQERKKQFTLDLSPIPAHGHSSFKGGRNCGQRTKHSSTSTCSLFAGEV
jgi:hypothetical protein